MRQAITPVLLFLLTAVTACNDSGSSSSNEIVDLFLLDDLEGQSYRMEEQKSYQLRIYGGSYETSTVTTWNWVEQPVASGAFNDCGSLDGFDVQVAARNLVDACTATGNCNMSFDQVSSADVNADGLGVFNVEVPVLKAPVGLKYRVEGIHENGQIVASNHTFCLVSINEPPVAGDDAYTVTEGVERVVGQTGGNLLTNDSDDIDESNQTLSVELVTPPSLSATFSLESDGSFRYLYTGDLAGGQILQDSFEYRLLDGTSSDTATVNLTIVTSDKAPQQTAELNDIAVQAGVGMLLDLSTSFTDPENGDLFYSVPDPASLPPSGNLVLSPTGQLTGTPALGDAGSYTVTFEVTDQVSTIQSTFGLTVTENSPPLASPLADLTVEFGELVSVDASAAFSDPEGVPLSFTLESEPASALSINTQTGLITGQVAVDGEYLITVYASDGINTAVPSSFTLTQLEIPNRAPLFVTDIDNQSIELGQPITPVTPEFVDQDGDTLTFSVTTLAPGLSFNTATGEISGTPTTLSSLSINITATDPDGLSTNSNAFTITVTEVPNRPPVFAANLPAQSGNVGVAVTPVSGSFSDPEGETLVYSVSTLPAGLSFDTTTGVISGTPTATFSNDVTITATDPDGASVSSNAFAWNIGSALNSAPQFNGVIADLGATVGESVTISTIAGAFSDADNDNLSFTLSSTSSALPDGLSLSTAGVISGVPASVGSVSGLIVQASDGAETAVSNAFTFVVSDQPNSAPVFSGSIPDATRTQGVQTTITTIAGQFSDVDDDVLTYSLASASEDLPDGLVLGSDGVITGTPTTIGTTDGIIISATDGELSAVSDPFSIIVSPVPNSAPELDADVANQTGTVGVELISTGVASNFSDSDGDALTFTLQSGDLPGGIELESSGAFTGAPTESGSFFNIVVAASDGTESVLSNPFSMIIAPAPNSPPEFSGSIDDQKGTVGEAFLLDGLDTLFSDDDGDTLVYAVTANTVLPPGLSISNEGIISGTPTTAGVYPVVRVRATDGEDVAFSNVFEIVIEDAPNTAPEFSGSIDDQTGTVGEDFVDIDVSGFFNDDDGDSLTFFFTATSVVPDGVTISDDGVISGLPSEAGTFGPVRVRASDGTDGVSSNAFEITIDPEVVVNSPPEFSGSIDDLEGTVDEALTEVDVSSLFDDGDGDTLTFFFSANSVVPDGVTISDDGVISGLPTEAGSFGPIRVRASDGTDAVSSNNFEITIDPAVVVVVNTPPEFTGSIDDLAGTVDEPFTEVDVSPLYDDDDGDTLTYSFSAASVVPDGLTISDDGVISGLPGESGLFGPIQVNASDGTDDVSSNEFDIKIDPAVVVVLNSPPEFAGPIPAVFAGVVDTLFELTTVADEFSDADVGDTLTFSVALGGGTLPSDLDIDPVTGHITGTPTESGSFPGIVIEATDGTDIAQSTPFEIEIEVALVVAD